MGCDIHMVLERRTEDGRWIGMHNFPSHTVRDWRAKKEEKLIGWSSPMATDRNYQRFANLAGVRGEGPDPRGMPDDASELSRMLADQWDGDGHSHSWLSLEEAAQAFLAAEDDQTRLHFGDDETDPRKRDPYDHYFGVYREDSDQYRIVFWFDN